MSAGVAGSTAGIGGAMSRSGGGSLRGALLARVLRLIGWRRTLRVAGVKYVERTTEPLHRALARGGGGGSGVKEYDAEFPRAPRMTIRATRARVYADLTAPRDTAAWARVEPLLRPGMRVLVLRGGTGYVGTRLARLVGPSGAVVSLDRDEESIRYAQRRYELDNTAFEVGHIDALRGETDGGFDLVAAMDAIDAADDAPAVAAELWRVVAPEGTLVLGSRTADDGDGPPIRSAEELVDLIPGEPDDDRADPAHTPDMPAPPRTLRVLTEPTDAWTILAATKPRAAPDD